MAMTLRRAAALCGGRVLPEYADVLFSGIGNDSRLLEKGNLFAALCGEDRDGFDFIPSAMEHGASAVLADRQPDGVPAVVTDDVCGAMGAIARGMRETLRAKIVGITGSVGKTTTKEMTAAVLASTFKTAKTMKNFNNKIGVPMTIASVGDDCEAVVAEMGMNHFGELSYLTSIVQPDIAVITNIGTMHIEYLGSRTGILKAKLEILEGLRENGTVIFNGDEPLLRNAEVGRKPLFFGLSPENDLTASEIVYREDCTSFRAAGLGADFTVTLPGEGKHLVYDALAAIAVGLTCGIPSDKIAQALAAFRNTGERQRIFTQNGFTVISDSYNAGPESMEAALQVLANRQCRGRKIAVLGDMLELGMVAQAAHYSLGKKTAEAADMVFAFGPNSKRVVAGAIDAGMPEEDARSYDSPSILTAELTHNARKGDILLFKGSRSMHMENIMEAFLNNSNEQGADK